MLDLRKQNSMSENKEYVRSGEKNKIIGVVCVGHVFNQYLGLFFDTYYVPTSKKIEANST